MASAEAALVAFDWPGNVRQLVNACRRLTVDRTRARRSAHEDIPPDLGGAAGTDPASHDWAAKLALLGRAGARRRHPPAARPGAFRRSSGS